MKIPVVQVIPKR